VQGPVELADDVASVGPVLLGAGARVGAGATLRRCVLGADVVVGARAAIDGAVVHAGARIGEDALVAGSVIGAGAVVGTGASVTDSSLVGACEELAGGTRLAGGRIPPVAAREALR
jgi:mannose-1-phosphate guanylyltransferase